MSYDISLQINTGDNWATVIEVGSYTSNVSPMWTKALGHSLAELHGMLAQDAITLLKEAIHHMEQFPEEYKPLNPPNNWGNYYGALETLKKILVACQEHYLCTIYISH